MAEDHRVSPTSSLPAAPPPSASRRSLLSRFRRDQSGAFAVEFALVAVPFIALLMAILEMAISLWSNTVLDVAVERAARQIYTGEFQSANGGAGGAEIATRFRTAVCNNVKGLFACENKLYVEVGPASAITSSIYSRAIQDGEFKPGNSSYTNTATGDIVIVRAAIEYPVFVGSLLGTLTSPLTSKNRVLVASVAFRNEPF